MKAFTGLLVFLLLTGCSTVEESKPTGPPAQVTVHREPSSRDSLFPMLIAVDGRPVTRLHPGEERSLEMSAGAHRLEYELGVYNCSTDVRLESGKTYVYRLAQGCVIDLEAES